MRARRFENGSLRIDTVKLSFSLDEDGRPSDCKVYERLDSHSLIEEFMLLANAAVAQKIAAGLPDQALLRRHEAPIERRIEGFSKRASRLGYDFDISSAGTIMTSFGKLQKEDPELVLRMLATKAMLRAKYICSGMLDIAAYHHYALNIPVYTHFTSPIRRYADVIVHRQLEAALSECEFCSCTFDATIRADDDGRWLISTRDAIPHGLGSSIQGRTAL
jgi:protein SSD1